MTVGKAGMVSERKYVMTRLRQGDYLLPSDDAQTLWRIYTYVEDGSLEREIAPGVYRQIKGTFWGIAKRPMPTEAAFSAFRAETLEDWENWTVCGGPFRTRKEAVEAAA